MTQQFKTRTERFHYTEIHTALEQYRDEEIEGKIVGIRYPTESSDGFAEIELVTVEDCDNNE